MMKLQFFVALMAFSAFLSVGCVKIDNDGDGWVDSFDCNFTDPDINPGAEEVCDDLDNDCDGEIDEGCDLEDTGEVTVTDSDSRDTAEDTGHADTGDSVDSDDTGDSVDTGDSTGSDDSGDTAGSDDTGDTDSATVSTWYYDADRDGYGDSSVPIEFDTMPAGYVENSDDCDDTNITVHPGAAEVCDDLDNDCDGLVDEGVTSVFYEDKDSDGFGNPGHSKAACEVSEGYVVDSTDCIDFDPLVNPAATEVCNEMDDNCDGAIDEDTSDAPTWYRDSDADGYGDASDSSVACEAPTGFTANSTDCDDTNNTVNPGASEVCDDLDNDCDGTTDEGVTSTFYADADNDTYGDAHAAHVACEAPSGYTTDNTDCDDTASITNPGAEEICDDADNNCDGEIDNSASDATTWYTDADDDGYGSFAYTAVSCSQPGGYVWDSTDCDDTEFEVNPSAVEVCDNADNDCDGLIDDEDPTVSGASTWYADSDADGYGEDAETITACEDPSGYSSQGGDCDNLNNNIHPGATEEDCTDPVDYNCDGSTSYIDFDGDGFAACEDCDDANPSTNPGASEVCNGADDDCDGATDESDAVDAPTWYFDGDDDSYGNVDMSIVSCEAPAGYVSDATDCDDTVSTTNPGAEEICDGADNNCNGAIDESAVDAPTWFADNDADGYGDASTTSVGCEAPTGYVVDNTDCDDLDRSTHPGANEYCNGVDDNCDGDIDGEEAVGKPTWYIDSDSDGYGAITSIQTCNQPDGYVGTGGDCNDFDAGFNPGASESDCVDPNDYNCDGSVMFEDFDGDGFAACTECDDSNESINPVADEVCDTVDNDCDGVIDEDDAVDAGTWYEDNDLDGYGTEENSVVACYAPEGYALLSGDCDDLNNTYNPGATESDCTDSNDYNCDGSTGYADVDADGWAACAECNDADPDIYPGASEHCNGLDDDCDGVVDESEAADAGTWFADADDDGYGDLAYAITYCTKPVGYVADSTDCDDTDADINPGEEEICDGFDNNCDGQIDDYTAVDQIPWYVDADGDGYGDSSVVPALTCYAPEGRVADHSDCDDLDHSVHPGATEYLDMVDNDCDDVIDEGTDAYDDDGDGFTEIDGDCDDTDPDIYIGATETCDDGVDQDCNGVDPVCLF